MRPSERVELEAAFEDVLEAIRYALDREVASFKKEDLDEGDELPTPGEFLDEALYDFRGPSVGFEEFLDALDRIGWELVRRPTLTKRVESDKSTTRYHEPRVKRVRGG
jgi:hypothetical protein